jgi:hypothetical protein
MAPIASAEAPTVAKKRDFPQAAVAIEIFTRSSSC